MLAVHKAGAAYVPLDPTFPPERLELMARDAEVRAVVSDRPFAGQWPSGIPRHKVESCCA
jgi:non-ribosomal peptide synthetase component F